jgi:hypothetical protein
MRRLGRTRAVLAAPGAARARARAGHAVRECHRRANDWEPLLWSRHGRDWAEDATPEEIAGRLMTGLRAGEVLLLHDADHYSAAGSWRHTVGALELLLPALKRNGLGTARA